MGPLAGPAVAAAVILPPGCQIRGVDDSKRLSPSRRTEFDRMIRERALAIGIGLVTVEEIERLNIYRAGLLAMRRALEDLELPPQLVLLDARSLPGLPWPQQAHIRGDASIHCVACASVVAKVLRDRLMEAYDRIYPGYGFARHRGYATRAHREALKRQGLSPIHRPSFCGQGAQLPLF